ncbi:MAG: hypothetical protein B7Z72_01020 [Gemmatimonadetes bacterium 21-71-4]|nr:MAG: hypothetical protein B7Z72_01020 [Gemmatimonadetes bacterium 21-71-4]
MRSRSFSMTDCPNAEVRDLLPDLLHDRLDEATRMRVEAHLRACEECRGELALLRSLRAAAVPYPSARGVPEHCSRLWREDKLRKPPCMNRAVS